MSEPRALTSLRRERFRFLVRPVLRWAGTALVVGLLALSLLSDVTQRYPSATFDTPPDPGDWLPVGSGAAAAAAATVVLLRRGVREGRTVLTTNLAVSALSVACSVAYATVLPPNMLTSEVSGAELLGIAVLAGVAVRRARLGQALAAAGVAAFALVTATGLREQVTPGDQLYITVLLLGLAVTVGLCFRLMAAERSRHVEYVLQQERLALARDLHDTLAHQVTGIVVHTQALRHLEGAGAARDPALVTEALGTIEAAGADALVAMRRLVAALREPGAQREPSRDQARLEQVLGKLVGNACGLDLPARLDVAPGVPEDLPAEVVAGIERVVQEALTNARRYARAVTAVEVSVRYSGTRIEVAVEDDGRAGHARSWAMGSGFGLVGMRERVDLLGGTFHAGPGPSGGWRVRAEIPVPGVRGGVGDGGERAGLPRPTRHAEDPVA